MKLSTQTIVVLGVVQCILLTLVLVFFFRFQKTLEEAEPAMSEIEEREEVSGTVTPPSTGENPEETLPQPSEIVLPVAPREPILVKEETSASVETSETRETEEVPDRPSPYPGGIEPL